MLCNEIMHRPVKWVAAEDTAVTAARVMRDENIGFLPVCDRSGRVIGIVTDRDIAVRLVAENGAPETRVAELMTRDIIRCSPTDELEVAEQLMCQHKKSRVLCTDREGYILGIVSLTDIATRDEGWRVANTLRTVSSREVR